MQLVPVKISGHLASFFFKESEGKESVYGNKKVKPVLFSTVSSIGKLIRLLMEKSNMPLKVYHFNLVISVEDYKNKKEYTGTFYKYESGRNSWLILPPGANADINDILEDIFKMAFISYMKGAVENNQNACVVSAIDNFIEKYDLLEFGFSVDTMRQQYYREKDNDKLTARFQNKKSNKVNRFHS